MPVGRVWERSQEPDQHVGWDLRFSSIRYLPEQDARGFHLMEYQTRIGFGLQVMGWGRYLSNDPLVRSTFEFGSEDPKSLITHGRGVWLYERRPEGTFFKTVFDYQTRHGAIGELLHRSFAGKGAPTGCCAQLARFRQRACSWRAS